MTVLSDSVTKKGIKYVINILMNHLDPKKGVSITYFAVKAGKNNSHI